MWSLGEVAVFASKYTEVWCVISKETELAVSLPAAVTEISVTLGTGHVVTPFCPLDVDLHKQKEKEKAIFSPRSMEKQAPLQRNPYASDEEILQAAPCWTRHLH